MTAPIEDQRQAALAVLRTLRGAGFEAYFVGGCVRDELMGRPPREFDVSTSAHPDEVIALFPHTVPLGKRFGVVLVVDAGIGIEVATFRTDGAYVDGRRPTEVRYTTAQEDAHRRDFTVNALFLDPETGELLDYVGGREDLTSRTLRAIGDAEHRFTEDKLRLMRAVRFATTGPFEIEPATWDAVCRLAPRIADVSAERICAELSRILVSGRSALGVKLLHESGLLEQILPEVAAMDGVEQPPEFHPEGDVLTHTLLGLEQFDALPDRPLELGLSVLLHDIGKPPTFRVAERIRFDGHARLGAEMAHAALSRLRFANEIRDQVVDLVARHMAFVDIQKWRPAKVRRFLTAERAEAHLALHRMDCLSSHGHLGTWEWCHERRSEFLSEPPPVPRLLSGHDLIEAGYDPSPLFGKVLAAVDDERLEGKLRDKEEALSWVLTHFPVDAT